MLLSVDRGPPTIDRSCASLPTTSRLPFSISLVSVNSGSGGAHVRFSGTFPRACPYIAMKPAADNEHDPTDQDSRTSFPDKRRESALAAGLFRRRSAGRVRTDRFYRDHESLKHSGNEPASAPHRGQADSRRHVLRLSEQRLPITRIYNGHGRSIASGSGSRELIPAQTQIRHGNQNYEFDNFRRAKICGVSSHSFASAFLNAAAS
jgi:hypothetical protein